MIGPGSNLGWKFAIALCAVALVFTFALSVGARARPQVICRDASQPFATKASAEFSSSFAVPESGGTSHHQQVTQYVIDFHGDHSLDVPTVVEQVIGAFSRYTIQLRLASGSQQSIDVTAPPGGLQLEMHDMTGDKIPNDLIIRPALLRWLPTVLLNDGHDHYAVAISGTDLGFMSSGQELTSRGTDDHGTVALMSSGFKTSGLTNDVGVFVPQVQAELLSPATRTTSQSLDYSSIREGHHPRFKLPHSN